MTKATTKQKHQYNGSWKGLQNTAENKKGSIHDDEPARKLGFKGAFVPGSVVAASAMPAILDEFGANWLNGGWYNFTFVTPVYTSDQVRTTAAVNDDSWTCRIESRDARLCCTGQAGIGYREPWSDAGGNDDVFPDAQVGQVFDEATLDISLEDVQPMLTAAGDDSSLWESIIHPEHLMAAALGIVDWGLVPLPGVKAPGMWAQHAIKVARSMPYGRYHIREYLAAKGISGRTHYVDFQFAVLDESGKEIAVGRHKCKFIRSED